jgi:hypothetical protein
MVFGRRPVVLLQLVGLLVLGAAASGCVTTLKPVYPSSGIDAGEPSRGVRFDADQITFDEPGVPVSTGRLWKRDVARFTAEQLNTLLGAPADGPVAQTQIALELASPGSFQVGAWKELTVVVSSQLPDGRLVRTEPKTALIDSNVEYALQQVLLFGGPILEVSAFVLGIYLFTGGFFSFTQYPWMCGCLLGLAFSGLFLNVAQASMQWLIGVLEERRASDLYQAALVAHAADVRAVLAGTKPAWRPPPAVPSLPGATPPADPVPAPPPPAGAPPPPLLQGDPADLSPPAAAEPPPAAPQTRPATPTTIPSEARAPVDPDDDDSADAPLAPAAPPPPAPDDDPLAPAPDAVERFRY